MLCVKLMMEWLLLIRVGLSLVTLTKAVATLTSRIQLPYPALRASFGTCVTNGT